MAHGEKVITTCMVVGVQLDLCASVKWWSATVNGQLSVLCICFLNLMSRWSAVQCHIRPVTIKAAAAANETIEPHLQFQTGGG